ncbi:hypothetical protein GDO78_011290 [Eleutherodactylus coqui]|uniref:Uncharacterized protein n=1 Tax=Eleutherodactylus coqui TaxID=57060 RepID=A0A8J6F868_ELECQ|nr:hypothetical protein GDO78_011290 [Eleutherodactylus coqui]
MNTAAGGTLPCFAVRTVASAASYSTPLPPLTSARISGTTAERQLRSRVAVSARISALQHGVLQWCRGVCYLGEKLCSRPPALPHNILCATPCGSTASVLVAACPGGLRISIAVGLRL